VIVKIKKQVLPERDVDTACAVTPIHDMVIFRDYALKVTVHFIHLFASSTTIFSSASIFTTMTW